MESMDNVHKRIEALEQQMRAMGAHTRTVERRLRWWRGLAYGLGLLGLVSLPLQSGTAADRQPGGMGERMATLLESGEFCKWPKLNTRGYPCTLGVPTQSVL